MLLGAADQPGLAWTMAIFDRLNIKMVMMMTIYEGAHLFLFIVKFHIKFFNCFIPT